MKMFVQIVNIQALESGPHLVSLDNIITYDIDLKVPSKMGKRIYLKLSASKLSDWTRVGSTFILDDENVLIVKKGA